jgi:hypothetical protein
VLLSALGFPEVQNVLFASLFDQSHWLNALALQKTRCAIEGGIWILPASFSMSMWETSSSCKGHSKAPSRNLWTAWKRMFMSSNRKLCVMRRSWARDLSLVCRLHKKPSMVAIFVDTAPSFHLGARGIYSTVHGVL